MPIWQLCANLLIPNCLRSNLSYSPLAALELYVKQSNATFYLSDPEDGHLGFAHEGYLNKFVYKIEKGKKVTIAITGDNKKTCLYVNGKLREELGQLTVYAMQQKDLISFQKNDITAWQPIMYNPSAKMHYQRTLVFPLQQAGNFKSQITGVKVVQNQE